MTTKLLNIDGWTVEVDAVITSVAVEATWNHPPEEGEIEVLNWRIIDDDGITDLDLDAIGKALKRRYNQIYELLELTIPRS